MKGGVIVFAKAPVPGAVKTRLISELGADVAAALYAGLIHQSLALALRADIGPVALWCAPSSAHPFFSRCAQTYGVTLHDQHGDDLGMRMAAAFQNALGGRPYAVLIGSDCPSLTVDDLQVAAAQLVGGCDAVLGPAEDGGYVLLGLRRVIASLFENIPWSSDRVLSETRKRLRRAGADWHELATRWDVDRPEDLLRLVSLGIPVHAESAAER